MNDLIDRQAAIEINRSYHGQMPNEVNHRIWKEINELPSVQPYTEAEIQKMQDLEQAQMDKAYELGYEEGKVSAQPDIVACGDCKHWICHDRRCGYWNHGVRAIDWCSHAERRTE